MYFFANKVANLMWWVATHNLEGHKPIDVLGRYCN